LALLIRFGPARLQKFCARAETSTDMDTVVRAGTRHRFTLREIAGLLIHALAALALVPAYLVLDPPAQWGQPLLLVVLLLLAIVVIRHDVPLPSGISFDATTALALIAVALAGPLPALAVIFPPIAVNALWGRERLVRAGNLANLAAYGWYTLAAALLLQAAGADLASPAAMGWLIAAGLLQLVVNFAVGPAIYATLWLGHPVRSVARMFPDGVPALMLMATLGAATVVLYAHIGMAALALFALVAIIPQSALTYAARTRPVALLDPLTATRRYANAMAVHLRLSRAERRELDEVIRLAHTREVSGDPGEHLGHAVSDWSEASCAAGHVTEWWNGAGGPAGLPGAIIPLSARIAAVARTWAALTAEGSPRLGHLDALAHLEGAAGVRLDPRVVKAARVVVGQERMSPAVPAPEPRLHHLRVPEPLRRALAAGA
jgi:HD domain